MDPGRPHDLSGRRSHPESVLGPDELCWSQLNPCGLSFVCILVSERGKTSDLCEVSSLLFPVGPFHGSLLYSVHGGDGGLADAQRSLWSGSLLLFHVFYCLHGGGYFLSHSVIPAVRGVTAYSDQILLLGHFSELHSCHYAESHSSKIWNLPVEQLGATVNPHHGEFYYVLHRETPTYGH